MPDPGCTICEGAGDYPGGRNPGDRTECAHCLRYDQRLEREEQLRAERERAAREQEPGDAQEESSR